MLLLNLKYKLAKFLYKENGEANIISVVIVLVIVVALGIIFKDKIVEIFGKLLGNVDVDDFDNIQLPSSTW